MGNAGWGAGSFAAGFAKSLTGSITAGREEERREAARKENQAWEVEKFKLATMLPQILANPDLIQSDVLATELPMTFGKGAKDGKSRLQQLQSQTGALGPLFQQGGFRPADHSDPAASVAGGGASVIGGGHDATSGIPTVSGTGNQANPVNNRAAGDIGPVATLFGAPVLSQAQQAQRDEQAGNQVDAATLRRRQTHAQALAQAGQPLQGQALQEYLLTGKLTLARPSGTASAAQQFEDYVADKKAAAAAAGTPWTTENTAANTLVARQEWEQANDPAAKAKAGLALTPQDQAFAAAVADNPGLLQGTNPTLQGATLKAIASDPALLAKYDTTRMAPLRASAQVTLDALKDLVTVDATTGQVTGLTPGATALYGDNITNRALSYYPGSPGARARASLNQITGQQVLDLIKGLKEQSKTGATGFGQLAVAELNILEAAATRLKSEIGVDGALPLLRDIYDKVQRFLAPPAAMNAGAPGGTAAGTPAGTPGQSGATPAASMPAGGPGLTPMAPVRSSVPAAARPATAAASTPARTGAGPAGMTIGPDGKLYLNGQLAPGQ